MKFSKLKSTATLWICRQLWASCCGLFDDEEVEIPAAVPRSKECVQLTSDKSEDHLDQNHSHQYHPQQDHPQQDPSQLDRLSHESHIFENESNLTEVQLEPVIAEPRSPVHSLSADILYYLVVSFLPLVDTASLALTCKSAFIAVDGTRVLQELRAEPSYRIKFLQRLELGFPDHILCYFCVKFHRRLRDIWQPQVPCHSERGLMHFGQWKFLFPYRYAKEVVNHYRFGPRHGRSEHDLVPQTQYSMFEPDKDIKGVDCMDIKCVDNGGGFNLKFRRYVCVEYNLSNPVSKARATQVALINYQHLWSSFKMAFNLTEELPPTCYRCEWCGAEREYSIIHLRDKPGYAALRTTLWESVGPCENTEHGEWYHVCQGFLEIDKNHSIPINQCELTHLHDFVDCITPTDRERHWDRE
ncbi:hypothetical protein A7D00_6496 [Trichophyton violaceum]|uniref:F-box domain-containing protein n=1 Tax=Trichophyton violaceum TaxID=34388 RepID=A0A178FD53_TRIVO|nr:hypothetical protein A7D00_6496 [Trichophyton violaceum]